MKVKWDVVATIRYKDRDGNEQKAFRNIGRGMEGDKGISFKLDSIPIGWDGWASFYEPKPKDAGRTSKPRDDDSSPPF